MRIILGVISFFVFPVGWALGAWQIFRKKNRIFGSILIGLGFLELVLFILLISSAPSVETDREVEVSVDASVADTSPAPTATSVSASSLSVAEITDEKSDFITDDQIELAKMMFKAFDDLLLLDSTNPDIRQSPSDNETYLLTVVVKNYINEKTGKEAGEALVRMLKSAGPDPDPGKSIGKGKFTYIVGVFYPDGTEIGRAYKCPSCTDLKW
tara:strand:- start:482 stop:1117 length:636 start_codon:yes stop_codon:yes gene_type:complete